MNMTWLDEAIACADRLNNFTPADMREDVAQEATVCALISIAVTLDDLLGVMSAVAAALSDPKRIISDVSTTEVQPE